MSKFSEAYHKITSTTTKMWGFEMIDPEGEWDYNPIRFNEKTHELSWGDISINVDEDCEDVDFALQGLMDACIEAGYSNGD